MIGLDQIEVIKPRTNPEMYEPKYRCTLCCVTAEIDPIYQQITVNHKFVSLETKLHLERRGEPVIG